MDINTKGPRINVELAESQIETPLWRKGMEYFEGGKVHNVQNTSTCTMTSEVSGSGIRPYKVSITIRDGKLVSHTCTCEAHKRYPGPCKHVVALLLKASSINNGIPKGPGDPYGGMPGSPRVTMGDIDIEQGDFPDDFAQADFDDFDPF